MSETSPLHYDIFISHNNADKEWASALANRLAAERYNGRPLRPWLDEQYIDPGDLASNSELTTAIDRSRTLGLVLSPAALASEWVEFELGYFLEHRASTDVILMLRQDCELPKALRDLPVLDFRSDQKFQKRFGELIAVLCPATEVGLDDVINIGNLVRLINQKSSRRYSCIGSAKIGQILFTVIGAAKHSCHKAQKLPICRLAKSADQRPLTLKKTETSKQYKR